MGERRSVLFSDNSAKRALKHVMKGGAQGADGKVRKFESNCQCV